jgi:hypothetical protein
MVVIASPAQRKMMRHIIQCRTASLGGQLDHSNSDLLERLSS